MSFVSNMRKVADELIRKYGSDVELLQKVRTGFDTTSGKNVETLVHHYTKGHVSPYSSADISDVILIDDMRVLIYADTMDVNKDWDLMYKGQRYNIISVTEVSAQNENVIYTLQCRGRNA